jgi:paired amphipathic helix protein Sin3a
VIHRVSSLFRGHPSLIKGFQTFLPPGYQLECSEQGQDAELTIITPTGAVIKHALPMSNDISLEQRIADPIGPAPIVPSAAPAASRPAPVPAIVAPAPTAAPAPVAQAPAPPKEATKDMKLGPMPTQPQPANLVATPGAASILGIQNPQRPIIEFNHAINYVNKIKQRFSGDPQTYKVFLEILQTYQKEQRPIQDVRHAFRPSSKLIVHVRSTPKLPSSSPRRPTSWTNSSNSFPIRPRSRARATSSAPSGPPRPRHMCSLHGRRQRRRRPSQA